MKKESRTRELGKALSYNALKILKASGGQIAIRDLFERIEATVPLDEWAKSKYEKSGYMRWSQTLLFYSIPLTKAGFIIKQKGAWFLTPEGEEATKWDADTLMDKALSRYKSWKEKQVDDEDEEDSAEESVTVTQQAALTIQDVERRSQDEIIDFINRKSPYEFQDLAAALLRGMGYFTPFVAPVGKDGGIDIIAYRDPLGTASPRIKVQIKHRPETTAPVQEIRQLMGVLQNNDVGIFISTGGFSSDARSFVRSASSHVELIDYARFISLWQDFYDKLSDEDKALMPLRKVYFLAPE